jgi:hypothetical protein
MATEGDTSIGDYLRSVEARLRRLPSDERSAILDNLEAHIHDSLRARRQGADPTPEDVRAVLAEMDPPEAFGSEPPRSRVISPWTIVGWVVLGALLVYLSLCSYAAVVLFARLAESHGKSIAVPALFLLSAVALTVAVFSKGRTVRRAAIVLAAVGSVGMAALVVGVRLLAVAR